MTCSTCSLSSAKITIMELRGMYELRKIFSTFIRKNCSCLQNLANYYIKCYDYRYIKVPLSISVLYVKII